MATLSIQVRLGISKSWRVKLFNKTEFYNQAVAHCLFVFSLIRMRGLRDQMWTLNYTVIMTGRKYYIYVEYFELPNYGFRKPFFWRSNTRSIPLYWRGNRRLDENKITENRSELRFSFLPLLSVSKKLRASAKYKTATIEQPDAVWQWAYKTQTVGCHLENIRSRLVYGTTGGTPASGVLTRALQDADKGFIKYSGIIRKDEVKASPYFKDTTLLNKFFLTRRVRTAQALGLKQKPYSKKLPAKFNRRFKNNFNKK